MFQGSGRRDTVHRVFKVKVTEDVRVLTGADGVQLKERRDGDLCPTSYSLCAASLGGDCCPENYACAEGSCYATTAAASSCQGTTGQYACPFSLQGGCCPQGKVLVTSHLPVGLGRTRGPQTSLPLAFSQTNHRSRFARTRLRDRWLRTTCRGHLHDDMPDRIFPVSGVDELWMLQQRHGLCCQLLLQHVSLDHHHHVHDVSRRLGHDRHHDVRDDARPADRRRL